MAYPLKFILVLKRVEQTGQYPYTNHHALNGIAELPSMVQGIPPNTAHPGDRDSHRITD